LWREVMIEGVAAEPGPPADRGTGRPSNGRRRVIPATCALHRGPVGFTNLLVSKRDGTIVLDPHATGCCVISLDEESATMLRDLLTQWLG
jgi:hypothetical protein